MKAKVLISLPISWLTWNIWLTNADPRSLFDMMRMGRAVLSEYCSSPYFSFLSYGCWCGPGSINAPPIDEFDSACKVHDECYGELQDSNKCPGSDIYWTYYHWDSRYDKANDKFTITCKEDPKEEECARGLCECDKAVVLELARLSRDKGCKLQKEECKKDARRSALINIDTPGNSGRRDKNATGNFERRNQGKKTVNRTSVNLNITVNSNTFN